MSPDQIRRLKTVLERQEALLGEIGVPVPVGRELARTADAAIVLVDLWMFSTAVIFRLRRLSARHPAPLLPPPLLPRSGRGRVVRRAGWAGRTRQRAPVDPFGTESLLVGMKFSDGRSAHYLGWGRFGDDGEPSSAAGPALTLDCLPSPWGVGGMNAFLLSEVPPAGPVALVVADPGLGIAATSVALDGNAMQEARTRVQAMPLLGQHSDGEDRDGPGTPPDGMLDR